jgi:hypothetical protein
MLRAAFVRRFVLTLALSLAPPALAQRQDHEPPPEPNNRAQNQGHCFLKCQAPYMKCQERCAKKARCIAGCAKNLQKCANGCGIATE